MKRRGRGSGMDRRQALRHLVAGAGASATMPGLGRAAPSSTVPSHPHARSNSQVSGLGSALPADPSLTAKDWRPKFFDDHQNETVIQLSDLIIPDTDTPGAKAALANRFIDLLLSASDLERQKEYLQALGWVDGFCISKYSRPFTKLDHAEQIEVLTDLMRPDFDPGISPGVESMRILKSSIVEAYYTSEIGLGQELNYQTNPFHAEFPGCKNPEEH